MFADFKMPHSADAVNWYRKMHSEGAYATIGMSRMHCAAISMIYSSEIDINLTGITGAFTDGLDVGVGLVQHPKFSWLRLPGPYLGEFEFANLQELNGGDGVPDVFWFCHTCGVNQKRCVFHYLPPLV